jgi:hypothetical protein
VASWQVPQRTLTGSEQSAVCRDHLSELLRQKSAAYTYDKLLLGLLDSRTHANDPQAIAILEQTTRTALPNLPGHAIEHA